MDTRQQKCLGDTRVWLLTEIPTEPCRVLISMRRTRPLVLREVPKSEVCATIWQVKESLFVVNDRRLPSLLDVRSIIYANQKTPNTMYQLLVQRTEIDAPSSTAVAELDIP